MKKFYTKPTAEKLAFQYRDQVVAASGGTESGNGVFPENPQIGGVYGNSSVGTGDCKWYLAEAISASICDSF